MTNNKKGKGKKNKGMANTRSASKSVAGDTRDEREEVWAISGTTNIVNEKGLVTTNNKIPGVCRHYHSNGGCDKGVDCAWRHFIPKEALECIDVGERRSRLREVKARRERDPKFSEPHIDQILKRVCPHKEMEGKPKGSWELNKQARR